jgi:hypothetical protein
VIRLVPAREMGAVTALSGLAMRTQVVNVRVERRPSDQRLADGPASYFDRKLTRDLSRSLFCDYSLTCCMQMCTCTCTIYIHYRGQHFI